MSILTIFTAALLCAQMSDAEEKEKPEVTPIPATKQEGHSAKAKQVASTNPSFSVTDTWTSFTVQPGGIYKLTSTNDYTGSEHASVTIECSTGVSLQNISIAVWWGNSLAPYLTLTDLISGSNFP